MIERINVFYKGLGSEDPGGAGSYAFEIYRDDEPIHSDVQFLVADAKLSRFIAEYKSVMAAMQWLIDQGKHPHHVRFHGDEPLIVNQLNRRWKPKHDLYSICMQTQFIQAGLKDVHFTWIAPEKNIAAKKAIDILIKNGIDPTPFLEAQQKTAARKIAQGEYK